MRPRSPRAEANAEAAAALPEAQPGGQHACTLLEATPERILFGAPPEPAELRQAMEAHPACTWTRAAA